MSVTLQDSFGRSIEYLRISVTDRCNFRCLYCMPLEGLEWLPKADILSYEEIAAIVGQLAPLGLRRIRITGGEAFPRSRTYRSRRMACVYPSLLPNSGVQASIV